MLRDDLSSSSILDWFAPGNVYEPFGGAVAVNFVAYETRIA